MSNGKSISVVVPVFNEEGNLRPLHEAVTAQLKDLFLPYEIIFVDDGSTDGSLAVLRELSSEDDHVKVVCLSRNFGHQNAVSAGMEYAHGSAVISMDGDLQHPPELIPKMIALWQEGYQVVYTMREDGTETGRFKRWTLSAYYKLIDIMADVPIVSRAADFRLMDRVAVDCFLSMPERTRFLRGMVSWIGFRQTGIPYTPNPRFSGRPKYSLRNMFGLGLLGIASFSTVPLRFSACVGCLVAVSCIPYALWAVYARLFTDAAVSGWASLLVAVLFLGGVQLVSVGIIGEYVGRIYNEVKGRPIYVTRELIGFDQPDPAPPLSKGNPATSCRVANSAADTMP